MRVLGSDQFVVADFFHFFYFFYLPHNPERAVKKGAEVWLVIIIITLSVLFFVFLCLLNFHHL